MVSLFEVSFANMVSIQIVHFKIGELQNLNGHKKNSQAI